MVNKDFENVQWHRNPKPLAARPPGRNQQTQMQVPDHYFNPHDNEEDASADGLSTVQTSRGRIEDNS